MTSWELKRIHTLALLQQANITLWDGWRVSDPVGDSPVLPAIREYAKTYKIKEIMYNSGMFGKPKPNLTLAMPEANGTPLCVPHRSGMRGFVQALVENTCKDGEICVYATLKAMNPVREWWRSKEGPGDPDVFAFPEGIYRWWVFGRGRGSKAKTLDLRGIE
jgi:hypothetical protein